MRILKYISWVQIILFLLVGCSKEVAQITGIGEHTAIQRGQTNAAYGFYIYLPTNYLEKENLPLLVFLHGAGETGDSKPNAETLNKVLLHGPPKLIKNQEWDPPEAMIVVSPQTHVYGWQANKVEEFLQYLIDKYKVDESRIYLTGLSMGGYGTYSYLAFSGDDSKIAAAVSICGGGDISKAKEMGATPIWAFHGYNDMVVPVTESLDLIQAINDNHPEYMAKVTIYPGVAHNSWTATYDNSGMGKEDKAYDPFNQNIYTWMLQFRR